MRRHPVAPAALPTLLALLALAAAPPARAADPGRLADGRRGSGEIARGQDREPLDQATVKLRESGAVEIEVRSFRGPYRFAGRWAPSQGKQVSLSITESYGRAGADGHGWISIDGGTFDRIEIDGRDDRGAKLAVSFRASGPSLGAGFDGLTDQPSGWGTLHRQWRDSDIREVTVRLAENGDAQLDFRGDRPFRLSGRWTEVRDDRIGIEITGGLDDPSARGTGTIVVRGERVQSLEIEGSTRGDRFTLEFHAGATPPRPLPSGGGFTTEYGFDQPGGDYRDFRADELTACQQACADDSRCQAYSYNTPDRRCYLKDRERPLVRRSDTVTGVKRGNGGGAFGLSERAGYNLEGGDYTRVRFRTVTECQRACADEDRCRAYTFNLSDEMCYLKDRVGKYTPRRDTVSGEKQR